jgi:hypothetical protein
MQFPGPVRAVVGLLADVAEEAKHLPDRAIELPMLAVSTALQASLRAQQRYARLAARGDEVLNRRRPTDDPPPWATFDEPVSIDELRRGAVSPEQAQAADELLDELLGPEGAANGAAPAAAAPAGPARTAAARKAPARKAAAKATGGAAAKKAPAKRAADVAKNVSQPRHTAPSRFDAVGDTPDD